MSQLFCVVQESMVDLFLHCMNDNVRDMFSRILENLHCVFNIPTQYTVKFPTVPNSFTLDESIQTIKIFTSSMDTLNEAYMLA